MKASDANYNARIRNICLNSKAFREAQAMIALNSYSGQFEYVMRETLSDSEIQLLREDGYRVWHEDNQTKISW